MLFIVFELLQFILNKSFNSQAAILENLVSEKEDLLINKDEFIKEKGGLITEKEWFLKEIHHRVKNNLQIVINLLNTQSAYMDSESACIAIRDSQNRMHSMSLIHKKLYQSENLASIDMSWYINELVSFPEVGSISKAAKGFFKGIWKGFKWKFS